MSLCLQPNHFSPCSCKISFFKANTTSTWVVRHYRTFWIDFSRIAARLSPSHRYIYACVCVCVCVCVYEYVLRRYDLTYEPVLYIHVLYIHTNISYSYLYTHTHTHTYIHTHTHTHVRSAYSSRSSLILNRILWLI